MGRGDERGQSELVGALLTFGIIIALLGFNQAILVPLANEDIEIDHDQTVRADMIELRSGIVEAAGSNSQQSVSVQLGTDFPPRLLTVNPGPATGTLQTDPPVGNKGNISVDADFNLRQLCGVGGSGSNVSTTFVTYDPNYNRFNDRGTTLVENTVTHREGGAVLDTNQVIVKGNQIRIIRVVGDYQESGSAKRSIDLFPSETNVTNTNTSFNITLPSQLNAVTWNRTLLEGENSVERVNGSDNAVTIELAKGSYDVKCTTVGIDEQPEVEVNPPKEEVPGSNLRINPIGSDALQLINVRSSGKTLELTFKNKNNTNFELNRTRVIYVISPGNTAGDEFDFITPAGDKTSLVIGEELKPINGTVVWQKNGRDDTKSVQIEEVNNQNSGVAIEFELKRKDETVKFLYFASIESGGGGN